MTLHLDRDMLVASYELLRVTRPFKAWKLPPASEVGFRVIRAKTEWGHYQPVNGRPTLKVSKDTVGTLHMLTGVLAHEMVHMHMDCNLHMACYGAGHGAVYKRLAAQVCKHHGFDPKEF